MTARTTIRFAIVGYGYIGKYHARAVRNAAGATLAGITDRDPTKAAELEADLGASLTFWESAEEVAADPDVDAVVIATPNRYHLPLARLFLESGKHLLVEKPMAMNAAEAREMADLAARNGRRILVGHMWRFDREALWLRKLLEADAIGRVIKTKGYGIHANWGPAGWFTEKALAGGGALIDMGVHALDTVRFLLGDPRPVSVYAKIDTVYGDYDVDDVGLIVVNWDGGQVSVIESGWWNPYMDGPEASTQLFGTTGYARLFPTALSRIVDHKPVPEKISFPKRAEHCDQHIYDGQVVELVRAIREDRDPIPGPDHGITVMEICDAAYRSAAERRVVEIPRR